MHARTQAAVSLCPVPAAGGARRRLLQRVLKVGFWFFLLKGLLWLGSLAFIAYSAST